MNSTRLVCGLLDTSEEVQCSKVSAKARSLTISWLRWKYSGTILEGKSVDEILQRAQSAGYDYCFLQSHGHIITERWSPHHDESSEFFHLLEHWNSTTDFFVTGQIIKHSALGYGLLSRTLLVNLNHYGNLGRPQYDGRVPSDLERCLDVSSLDASASPKVSDLAGAAWIAASLTHGLPVYNFNPAMGSLMLDLGSGLTQQPQFIEDLRRASEDSRRGVFVWNFESYDDIAEPPESFSGPVSVLYSVAAGLKPNMILHTHGFDELTRVVFFDYSSQGLAFRKLLYEEWDGEDYPSFLRSIFRRLPPPATYYFLWPGTSAENPDWSEMDRLWDREVTRWGGARRIREHWARYRSVKHSFVLCNLLTEQHKILDLIADVPGSVIWWSNAFSTVYSGWRHTPEEKMKFYENWVRDLAAKAPTLLLYGSDHSNSSVNCIHAGQYWEQYRSQGGEPLSERSFHRREIRF
jgi:hypothetical protein